MIEDIQSNSDTRAVSINHVGIRRLKLPMLFYEETMPCPTIGEWTVATNLPADRRGTHMSRLVRTLHDDGREIDFARFCHLPDLIKQRLSATNCFLSVNFPYFTEKSAPISNEKGFLDSTVALIALHSEERKRHLLQITTPVTSLCPCSKAISAYGAHNQRSNITVTIEPQTDIRPRDLIAMAESSASCELFSVLKRSDERHVTERAYDNPKFVEDIARDLVVSLRREKEIKNYHIEVENYESIHNHSAHAIIQSDDFPTALLSGKP